jgi:hypothetical protein
MKENDPKNCPDGTPHIFKEDSIWFEKENLWRDRETCIKCNFFHFVLDDGAGCFSSSDRQHKIKEGYSFSHDLGMTKYWECKKCKRYIEIPVHEWDEDRAKRWFNML